MFQDQVFPDRKHQQKYLDILVPYYSEIINEYTNIHCADLQAAFQKLSDSDLDKMYLDDGLHLNDKGTSYVADYINPVIKEILSNTNRI